MTNAELVNHPDTSFKYMMFDRLLSDARNHLNHGGKLWGIKPQSHAITMAVLYDSLPKAPEWVTRQEIIKLLIVLMKGKR